MDPARNEATLSWVVTSLAITYVLWCAYSLTNRVDSFGGLFEALGAELPVVTGVALTFGKAVIVWPAAVVTSIYLIAKEFRLRSTYSRLSASAITFMIWALLIAIVTEALFQPMLQLLRQIG
jgi:hypothetical protein